MDSEQFLDLAFFFRLQTLHTEDEQKAVVNIVAGTTAADTRPKMQTEAAQKIPVPSWWQGETTLSSATMIADRMRRRE